jgi:hypothetical protein
MKDNKNQIPYATTLRRLNDIYEEMGCKAWTLIPDDERNTGYAEAYKAIGKLLKKTKIPVNIDDN